MTPKGTRIAHVGIAVRSIDEAMPFFQEILGLEETGVSDSDGAKIRALQSGESLIELLEADGRETPIGKFMAKRGPAMHHICFAVDDLDAALERCAQKGIRLIDQRPRIGAEGKRIAFIHPSSTAGILVELSEK